MIIALCVFYFAVCVWLAHLPTPPKAASATWVVVLGEIAIICGIVMWPTWLPVLAVRSFLLGLKRK